MVVKLSDRVDVEWFKQVSPICEPAADEFPVSGIGTVAAARITPRDALPFIVVVDVCPLDQAAPIHQEQMACGLCRRLGAPNHL